MIIPPVVSPLKMAYPIINYLDKVVTLLWLQNNGWLLYLQTWQFYFLWLYKSQPFGPNLHIAPFLQSLQWLTFTIMFSLLFNWLH